MKNSRTQIKDSYEDVAMAHGALSWIADKLDKELALCANVADGKCYTWWRHEDCKRLMNILFDITGNQKYISKEIPGLSWD